VFPVRGRDLAGQGENKAPVLIEFLGPASGADLEQAQVDRSLEGLRA
jgi:hypothetical protein